VARHVTVPWYCHLLCDDDTLSDIYNFTGLSHHSSGVAEDGRMRHMLILPSISDFAKLGVRSRVQYCVVSPDTLARNTKHGVICTVNGC
jgi:hypothetical protein